MTEIQIKLTELSDDKYADFQAKLTPGIPREKFIGVKIPVVRSYTKQLIKEGKADDFLSSLPHEYFDEYILHSVLLSQIKDFDKCISYTEAFLPYIDNWAVCDILSPKVFKKNTDKLLEYIYKWSSSDHTYTIRFAIEMLMSFYLDDKFKEEYLQIPASVISDEYYVNMMLAWFYATALAKQWDSTVQILISGKLPKWVHNKTIQKARESFRITNEQKNYLKGLKQ